jgi:sugar phosphate isomerase/epimerase
MTRRAPSVQLYTVREALAADIPGTLDRLLALGFRQVEPHDLVGFGRPLAAALAAAGLAAPTAHQGVIGRDMGPILDAAAAAGVGIVIDPYAAPERFASADEIAATADALNEAARHALSSGVRIGYHNHAHELSMQIDGVTALERLAARLDPAVALEVDTYWAAVGGADPVALLERLGERVVALHLKDGPFTTQTADQVPLGQGRLPVSGILAAAPRALRVLELDDTRGDRFEALEAGLAYLTRVDG